MDKKVRIVVSPEAAPDLNEARSALFNSVFARRYNARVLLRLADMTPAQPRLTRYSGERHAAVLAWLGLSFSEERRQSEREDLYPQIARRAMAEGRAYPCFCTLEELRKRLRAPQGYDRKCFFLSLEERRERLNAGVPYRVRLINPIEGEGMFVDAVRGPVKWQHAEHEDQVLVGPSGHPSYAFASAVDDHEDQVTDAIQADEWLPSAIRQVTICHGLGWEPPRFAHLPALLNEAGELLYPHREEAYALVENYRRAGTHPDALLNYLAWPTFTFADKRQKFSLAELAEHFDFGRIGKMQPRLDTARLTWLQEQYSR